jgi:hypothetical protein
MAYGTIKVDTVTFTDGGIDKSVSISGLVQNPTFSGNITVTGTISGNTVQGQTVSGATVTGNAAAFTTVTGGTATITSGVFASGTAGAPSVSVGTTDNGIYSPGTDQVAVATNGTGRLFVDAAGGVTIPNRFVIGLANNVGGLSEATITTGGVFNTSRLLDGSTNPYLQTGAEVGIVYFNADGSSIPATVFRTGGTERLRITSAGLVGIGTASVNALLEVNNSTAGGEVQRIEGNYDGSGSVILTNWRRAGGSVAAALKYNDDSSPLCMSIGTTTSHEFRIRTADTDAITIDTSQRVGIGTSAPSDPLHIAASGANTAAMRLQSGDGRTYSVGSTGSGYGSSGKFIVYDNTAGAERFCINSSGLVGIGTTSPNTPFVVSASGTAGMEITPGSRIDSSGRLLVGTASTSGNIAGNDKLAVVITGDNTQGGISVTDYAGVSSTIGSYAALRLQRSLGTTDGSFTALTAANWGLGRIEFNGSNGVGFGTGATIEGVSDALAWGNGDHPARLVFSTTADGASSPTERLRITSAGLVGIGTSSPGQKLDVNGEIVCSPNTAGKNTFQFTTQAADDASLVMRSNTTVKVNIQANGTSYFDGGNVGIGTTSPGSYNANLAVYSAGGAFVGSLHDGTFGTFPKVSAISLGADTVSYTYTTNGTTVALTGSAHIAALQSASAGAGTDIAFLNTAGGSVTEKARIDSSGRLLVGTASSLLSYSKLQVQGGAGVDTGAHICLSNENSAPSSGSNIGSVRFTNNAGGIGAILGCEADGAWTAGSDYRSRLVFSTTADGASSTTERLRITSAGLVGIGTGSPSASLHVIGGGKFASSTTSGSIVQAQNSDLSSLGYFGVEGSTGGVTLTGTLANSTFISSGASGTPLQFGTNGVIRSTLTSTGLGIGTTAPSYALHVSGTGEVSSRTFATDATGAASFFVQNDGNAICGPLVYGSTKTAYGALASNETAFYSNRSTTIMADGGSTVIKFATGGNTERARIDSSGRLLVGTATSVSNVYVASSAFQQTVQVATATNSYANGFTALNYSAVGYASVLTLGLSKNNTLGSDTAISSGDDLGIINFVGNDGTNFRSGAFITATCDGAVSTGDLPTRLVFSTTADGASSPTERMRITKLGALKISTTGSYLNNDSSPHEIRSNVDNNNVLIVSSAASNGTQYGLSIRTADDQNDTTRDFLECQGGGVLRAQIRSNGGLANYSANNANLSDRNAKKDISPAADTWNCLKEWEIVNYRYKDQPAGADLNLGVIAQQVATICPEVITVFQEAREATEDRPAQEKRLGVKEQQMYWMAIKALQEAQVRIEQLEQRLNDAGIN